jgi:SAM-dependent methyltransferase
VFNAEFEPDITPYDENYENRQGFSPVFRAHVTDLIGRLAKVPGVRGGRILEVGCGKGDFLREAAATTGARADGYDTSYEGPPTDDGGRIRFFSSYVSASNVDGQYDAVICRHVVEHVPGIGAFLKELAGIARAAGDPLVVLETPRFEWIVENRCLWDVFYEHCNYFTQPALAHLARLAGFKVVRHTPVFGDQYQWLELRLAGRAATPEPPGIPPKARLSTFARSARRQLDGLVNRIRTERGRQPWAIWGAGAKGVALANLLPRIKPACVVDSNPAKQGGVLTGTSIPIIAPQDPRIGDFGLVVIANPNYAEEIRADLAKAGFSGKTFCL